MRLILALALVLMSAITSSCSKQKPEDKPQAAPPKGRVFVCCEGNFMFGNASLSLYNPEDGAVRGELFYDVNNFPLGDVLQSMSIIDGKAFMVVNNSGKVVVMDPESCKYIGAITGLNSPRYVEPVSETKIYISDLYSPYIAIADPLQMKVTGQIYLGRSSEQMASHGGFVYTCWWSFGDKVYKIDSRADKVVDSLTVALQPNSIAIDKYGKLWVLSDGSYKGSPVGQQTACLTVIDTDSFTIESRMEFENLDHSPSRLTTNAARDTIYYIKGGYGSSNVPGNGVCRLSALARELPTETLIPENGRLFYGLGIDPLNGQIYVSDAIDYVQSGTILRYSPAGQPLSQFKVGVTPGSFCFKD